VKEKQGTLAREKNEHDTYKTTKTNCRSLKQQQRPFNKTTQVQKKNMRKGGKQERREKEKGRRRLNHGSIPDINCH